MTPEKNETPPSAPWYRHGMVWMIISGPAIVIVAGFVTLYLAIRTPDPVITPDYYRQGIEINKTLPRDRALMPAVQGRNHANTPADEN